MDRFGSNFLAFSATIILAVHYSIGLIFVIKTFVITCTPSYSEVSSNSGNKGDDCPSESLGVVIQRLHVWLGELYDRNIAKQLRGNQDEQTYPHDRIERLERNLSHNLTPFCVL